MVSAILEILTGEENALRERGLDQHADVLAYVRMEVATIVAEFLCLRMDKEQAAEAVGYSIREVYRWLKEGMPVDESGKVKLIDLPVKPGYLASVIGAPPLSELNVSEPNGAQRPNGPPRLRWVSRRRRFPVN